MSQNVPAWKKIGLKIKEDVQDDPIALTTHIEDVQVTNKQAKKLNKQKRKLEESNNDDKKAPKRVKLPKSERAPPPEKDQLAYLRQYENDKSNWKFSKQKQNWILKNIKNIPKDYEAALQSYLEGLQGGSRKRVVDDLMEVVKKWNKAAEDAEARVEREIQRQLSGETTKDSDDEDEEKTEDKKAKRQTSESEETVPDYDYAKRCGVLVKILNDEDIELKGIAISDDDIKIGGIGQESEELTDAIEKIKQTNDKEEEEEADNKENDNIQDNLTIDEVEVSGLSKSDGHIDRIERNKEKFNDISGEKESHETASEKPASEQELQTKDEKKDKSKKKNKDKAKDLSEGKIKNKKDKKEKKKDKKKNKD